MHKFHYFYSRPVLGSDYVNIWRMNPQTGAKEVQRYPHDNLPNYLKRLGWKVEVKGGKKLN